MALEFAIRGSWAPVLSARLLGPLKMTGKQAGWIYAMYPLTCIAAPLIAGQIVDRWIATEWFLGAAHLVSGIALLAAARMTKFRWLLALIGIHCLFFSPTLGLVNSLTFSAPNQSEGGILLDSRMGVRRLAVHRSGAVALASFGQVRVPRKRRPDAGRDSLAMHGGVLSALPAAHATAGRSKLGVGVGPVGCAAPQTERVGLPWHFTDRRHTAPILLFRNVEVHGRHRLPPRQRFRPCHDRGATGRNCGETAQVLPYVLLRIG